MAAEKHRDARAGRVIGTARSSLDRDEIFLDLLPSASRIFRVDYTYVYIYIYVSVMRRKSGCSLDDGDYGSVKFFFQGNVTILISKFVALSVIDRFLMPFLKYFILFHPIFDEPCAGWNYHFCLWSGRKIIFETAIFILIKIFWKRNSSNATIAASVS